MAQTGLTSIQRTLEALQEEILHLRGAGSSNPTDGILNIRTKFLEQKIEKLNNQFIEMTVGDIPLVKLVIMAMEFVEEYGYKYADYLSCSNSGPFKLELALNLLSKIGEYDHDIVRDIIQTVCSATKQILCINEPAPENTQIVRKPTNGKLRKFLHRSKTQHQ
jgi:hypothetical protein